VTPDALAGALRELCPGQGWLARGAALLGVNPRGLRQMLAGDRAVPPGVAQQLGALLTGGDRWVLGDGDRSGGAWLIHLRAPRFAARLVDEDDPDTLRGADTLAGLTLSLGGALVLCQIVWIDPPPADLQPLLAEAAEAVGRLLAGEALGSP
jgi:hypothetical protein